MMIIIIIIMLLMLFICFFSIRIFYMQVLRILYQSTLRGNYTFDLFLFIKTFHDSRKHYSMMGKKDDRLK